LAYTRQPLALSIYRTELTMSPLNTNHVRHRITVALTVLSAASAHGQPSPSRPTSPAVANWTDSNGRANRRLAVADAAIHFIDYGGRGSTLVFLAGLGNSAHVFDEFAPRFTGAYRVIAITRRGYGESSKPSNGYDTQRLGDDVIAVLDSLDVDRAILAGHSVAGDELTDIAARAPGRVAALVYLDAADDRSSTAKRLIALAATGSMPPAPPKPTGRERSSPASYRAYLARIYGMTWPMSEVLATREFDGRGRYARDVTGASTNFAIMRGESPLPYAQVRAPVLAIYAVERGVEQDYPWIRSLTVGRGKAELQAARAMRAEREWQAGERRRLRSALPNARVVELAGASHYVFVSNASRVEQEMRGFLAALDR
jgi:pimeloyl-ACP methyl ester carboxylesterase